MWGGGRAEAKAQVLGEVKSTWEKQRSRSSSDGSPSHPHPQFPSPAPYTHLFNSEIKFQNWSLKPFRVSGLCARDSLRKDSVGSVVSGWCCLPSLHFVPHPPPPPHPPSVLQSGGELWEPSGIPKEMSEASWAKGRCAGGLPARHKETHTNIQLPPLSRSWSLHGPVHANIPSRCWHPTRVGKPSSEGLLNR